MRATASCGGRGSEGSGEPEPPDSGLVSESDPAASPAKRRSGCSCICCATGSGGAAVVVAAATAAITGRAAPECTGTGLPTLARDSPDAPVTSPDRARADTRSCRPASAASSAAESTSPLASLAPLLPALRLPLPVLLLLLPPVPTFLRCNSPAPPPTLKSAKQTVRDSQDCERTAEPPPKDAALASLPQVEARPAPSRARLLLPPAEADSRSFCECVVLLRPLLGPPMRKSPPTSSPASASQSRSISPSATLQLAEEPLAVRPATDVAPAGTM